MYLLNQDMLTGLFYVVIAGSLSGTFSVPFLANRGWRWENNWFIWSFVALLIAPWVVALFTVPHLGTVLQAETGCLLLVALFGLIWGAGAILFGKGIDRLGVSLGLPIMLGLINSVGTLMPIALRDPAELLTQAGIKLLAGVGIILTGIIVYSIAGSRKETGKEMASNDTNASSGNKFKKGLIICILAGVFGPMINFGFVYGEPLQERAVELGASPLFAANAIWCIVLTAGFVINAAECMRLFKRGQSFALFRTRTSKGILFGMLAGVMWYLSIMFYGMGSNNMGAMGASAGWATMQSLGIVASNVAGQLAGEWKGSGRKPYNMMLLGMALLVAGVIVVAY